ncbi:MAG: A/G-specific adenine glycosylase [Actinomycetaceae bacterium]|nr:A/G-specific adenine glycosylase [Arcanobacterium sp.]MDD7686993.1 A/G-specific adenine glycosylase [Actinomycetaceae bacterium]MDY5273351.1 A/G-specific adenine glycosylase [Arcanobacterium sp.]
MDHEFPAATIAEMHTLLTQWYSHSARDLPWRDDSVSPWGILVCEVMSQQTPVARVVPTWLTWMHRWPTPPAMARASAAEVLIAWDRLGYPRRALRLLECARILTEHHSGKLPKDRNALLALPGIGEYTADALLAFAFHAYSVVLDTNIRRVLARWHGDAFPTAHLTKAERERATIFVPKEGKDAARWNQAVMELGAIVCTATSPQCQNCPVAELCGWKLDGYPRPATTASAAPQKFAGTQREARGKIMAVLRAEPDSTFAHADLLQASGLPTERFTPALQALVHDGLARELNSGFSLP